MLYINAYKLFNSATDDSDVQEARAVLQGQHIDVEAVEETKDEKYPIEKSKERSLSVKSILRESPYTKFFSDAIRKPDTDVVDSEMHLETQANPFFSPATFRVIQKYIHLIPLWSAMLQNSSKVQLPKGCQSNAVIESHFKSVKHGMLGGRKRLPAREFLNKSLVNLNGALNEKMLPQTPRTKGRWKAKVIDDEREVWCKRKTATKRKYADITVAKKLFGRVKTPKIFEKKSTAKNERFSSHIQV